MAFGIDSVNHELEDTLFVDDESRTYDAKAFDTIHFFRLPDTVLLAYRPVRIREKSNGYAMLVAKFGMPDAIIATDANNDAIMTPKFVLMVGKVGGF